MKFLAVQVHSPVTTSLFGLNILHRTLFSNNLSLYTSLAMRDQFPHPFKTTSRIMGVWGCGGGWVGGGVCGGVCGCVCVCVCVWLKAFTK
jgi:hypothetical protein